MGVWIHTPEITARGITSGDLENGTETPSRTRMSETSGSTGPAGSTACPQKTSLTSSEKRPSQPTCILCQNQSTRKSATRSKYFSCTYFYKPAFNVYINLRNRCRISSLHFFIKWVFEPIGVFFIFRKDVQHTC